MRHATEVGCMPPLDSPRAILSASGVGCGSRLSVSLKISSSRPPAGDGDQQLGRGRNLYQRGGEPLRTSSRNHGHSDHPEWVEEGRLQHRILQACGTQPLAFEAVEAEVRDQLRSPGLERRASFVFNQETLLAVEQQNRGGGCRFRHPYAAIVTLPWFSHGKRDRALLVGAQNGRRQAAGKTAGGKRGDQLGSGCSTYKIG